MKQKKKNERRADTCGEVGKQIKTLWSATSARSAIALYHWFTCCGRRRSLAAILSVYKWIRSELMAPKNSFSVVSHSHTKSSSLHQRLRARAPLKSIQPVSYSVFSVSNRSFQPTNMHTLFPIPFFGFSWSQVNEFYMAKKKKKAEREKKRYLFIKSFYMFIQ